MIVIGKELNFCFLIKKTTFLISVLVTTYCGNLVAFLTFPKIDTQIKTIADLIDSQGSVKWGMRAGTYLEDYLKTTDVEKYRELFDGSVFYPDENEEIIADVRAGKN